MKNVPQKHGGEDGFWKTAKKPQGHIKCADCVYVRLDKTVCVEGITASECGNIDSEYYKSILNMRLDGKMAKSVTWSGCAAGMVKE